MTYPASPNNRNEPRHVRVDAVQLWAGGVATAIVAAFIALVGILICRWTLGIPILAPSRAGAWGDAHTPEYVFAVGLIGLAATGIMYLLALGTPSPGLFFGWIIGLATVVAVVYPFSTTAPLDQKAATAVVDLVIGIAIGSLLSAVAARSIRRNLPPPRDRFEGRDRPYDTPPYDPDATRPVYRPSRTPGEWR
ncbi:MAG TPA: DUF6069 family protein [Trebonia sp.]